MSSYYYKTHLPVAINSTISSKILLVIYCAFLPVDARICPSLWGHGKHVTAETERDNDCGQHLRRWRKDASVKFERIASSKVSGAHGEWRYSTLHEAASSSRPKRCIRSETCTTWYSPYEQPQAFDRLGRFRQSTWNPRAHGIECITPRLCQHHLTELR